MKYQLKNGKTVEFYNRKNTRLPDFDYSQDGIYFITICSKNRENIFGTINNNQDLEEATVDLNEIGKIVEFNIRKIEDRYKQAKIETYSIMPNHVHILISLLNNDGKTSIPQIIGSFKSLVTKECREKYSASNLFQVSYNDHIVRNEKDYNEIFNYIIHNPGKWIYDCFYNEK